VLSLQPQSGGGHSWGFGPDLSYLLEIFVVGLSSIFGFRLGHLGLSNMRMCPFVAHWLLLPQTN
jgi:hypothetical protein